MDSHDDDDDGGDDDGGDDDVDDDDDDDDAFKSPIKAGKQFSGSHMCMIIAVNV